MNFNAEELKYLNHVLRCTSSYTIAQGRESVAPSVNHYELMDKIKNDMESIGRVELQPKFDGKQMIMVIQPL